MVYRVVFFFPQVFAKRFQHFREKKQERRWHVGGAKIHNKHSRLVLTFLLSELSAMERLKIENCMAIRDIPFIAALRRTR